MSGLIIPTRASRRAPLWNRGVSPATGMVFLVAVAVASTVGWNALAAAVCHVQAPPFEQTEAGRGAAPAARLDEMATTPDTVTPAPEEPLATSPGTELAPVGAGTRKRGDGATRPAGQRRGPRGSTPAAEPGHREVVGASDREDPLDGLDFGNLAG